MLKLLMISWIHMSMTMFLSSYAQTCVYYAFPGKKIFKSCSNLPHLNYSIHWNYDPSTSKFHIAYRHYSISPSRWVAWAINPTSSGMIGAQALVAYQHSNGSMRVYTAPINSYRTQLEEGKLSFDVDDLSADYGRNEIVIYATLRPPSNGTISLQLEMTEIHGVLNTVSWGLLIPTGALIARYLRVYKSADRTWFYLHIAFQSLGYIIGVSGFATALKYGMDSPGITFTNHRTIAIVVAFLGTLQVFALFLRPKKDHEYKFCWNIYHHLVGYAVMILSFINILKGFDILKPEKKWKHAYIAVVIVLACNFVWLEVFTRCIVFRKEKIQHSKC